MSTKKKKPAHKDPQAEREAKKYEFPVPSRELILKRMAEFDEPLSFEQIANALDVTGDRDIEAALAGHGTRRSAVQESARTVWTS